jgi:HSP20 family protein
MNQNEVAVEQNNDEPCVAASDPERCIVPAADIIETPEAYLLLVDLPGAAKEGMNLKIERNVLTIQAPRQQSPVSEANMIHRELPSHGYFRTFALGDGVDASHVDAHFDQGVLTVKLFKSEQMKPREITIN